MYHTVLYCTVLYRTVLYRTVLYCTVLYCAVLYCDVLCCTVLCCAVLNCTVLYCTVLYCTVLYCTVLCCTELYCTILCCAVLYCTIPYCTILYCTVRTHCTVIHTVLLVHTFYPVMRIQTQRAVPVLMVDILVTMNQADLPRPACISLIVATSEVYTLPLSGHFKTEWCILQRGVGWLQLAAGTLGNNVRFFCAFSSAVRQMPGYTLQRQGTVCTLPN